MGATHGDAETYPRLGSVIGFVEPAQVTAVAEAVVTAQRDFGNREVRKRARLKYTIDDRGLEWFKTEVERRAGFSLPPARPFDFVHNGDRFGWTESGDGYAHLTLRIPAGRIVDGALDGLGEPVRHLSGLRAVAQLLADTGDARSEFRMTPNQNLVIAGVPSHLRARVDALVAEYALDGHRSASPLRRNALACVALPTCGLAMAEAERYLPDLVTKVDALLARHAIADAPIHLRISGCPNGCSRPYLGEIALVGKAPGRYNLMLGADHRGQRLNTLYRENIDEAAILAALDPLFAAYARDRIGDEGFGDFLVRTAVVSIPERDSRPSLPLQLVA
jgi:sulfite reductase (NADPH) hemoprotein beta-component